MADGAKRVTLVEVALRDEQVEEFFVIPQAQRRGVGVLAARSVFAWQAGRWTLTVRPENPGALAFWRRAMPEAEEREEPGEDGIVRSRMMLAAS